MAPCDYVHYYFLSSGIYRRENPELAEQMMKEAIYFFFVIFLGNYFLRLRAWSPLPKFQFFFFFLLPQALFVCFFVFQLEVEFRLIKFFVCIYSLYF